MSCATSNEINNYESSVSLPLAQLDVPACVIGCHSNAIEFHKSVISQCSSDIIPSVSSSQCLLLAVSSTVQLFTICKQDFSSN